MIESIKNQIAARKNEAAELEDLLSNFKVGVDTPKIVLKSNNISVRLTCPLSGISFKPDIPFAFFIEGGFLGGAPVSVIAALEIGFTMSKEDFEEITACANLILLEAMIAGKTIEEYMKQRESKILPSYVTDGPPR